MEGETEAAERAGARLTSGNIHARCVVIASDGRVGYAAWLPEYWPTEGRSSILRFDRPCVSVGAIFRNSRVPFLSSMERAAGYLRL